MKLKFLLAAVAGLILSVCNVANAGLITENGHTLDTNTNIITGNSLEWLSWDVTRGLSIEAALNNYSSQGWTLASNTQMADLFNGWQFASQSLLHFGTDERTEYDDGVGADANDALVGSFHRLFGEIVESTFIGNHPRHLSLAMYGSDLNGNGIYNHAVVSYYDYRLVPKVDPWDRDYQVSASLFEDFGSKWGYSSVNPTYGVALVRAASSTSVPEPSTLAIFALGIMGLASRRFKKQ